MDKRFKDVLWTKKIYQVIVCFGFSLFIVIGIFAPKVVSAAFNRGTHSNTHIFHIAKDNGDVGEINKWIRVTNISVSGQRVTWVVEYNPTEQASGIPFHNFGLGQDIIESTLRIQREQWRGGAYQPERNLTGSDYGLYPSEIERRTKYNATVKAPLRVDFKDLYEQNRTTSDQQSGNPVGDANLAELQRFHGIDTNTTPRIGYWYKSYMAKGKYRYTISVDIRQGVNPYSVPFIAMFDANMNSRRWVVAYTDLGNQPTSAPNKRNIYLFKNTLIKTVGSNDQPDNVDRAKIADITDADGIASIRVIAENGNDAGLGYNVDANGAYGTPNVDKGLYSRGLRVTDRKGVVTDFFRASANMYKTYIADVVVNGEITKDPGGALTTDQQNALRTEILNKVTIDGGTAQSEINNKYRKVIIGNIPTSGWGNRVTVRVISESKVYKDVEVVVNFKELPTINQYDISWENASVENRNDIGLSWANNNTALVYKYNVNDSTDFDTNKVLKQLRATAKTNVDANRYDKRALNGNEKLWVENGNNGFSNYADNGPARYNNNNSNVSDDKNVNYLDIVNPSNLWGGRPVVNSDKITCNNAGYCSMYNGVNGPISSSVSVPQANGVSTFNITGNGLLQNTLTKQKVYIGTAPAIARGGSTSNDTDGVGQTIPIYFIGYIPNQEPSIAKRDIVIWRTNNSDIKPGLKDVIQDQEIPITDPDNPMTFNANNVSVVEDGTGNAILPNISFKIQNGKVYMSGYADVNTRYTANFKVTDGPHNVTGPDIWIFVAEANGGDIVKNIGESVSLDEVKNKVVVSQLSDLNTSKISKELFNGETLPNVNENKTVLVKVTYNDPEKANTQYKVVPVNIFYNVIDRTDNPSAATPQGYVRITLNADATKGRITVNGRDTQTKVYDVKSGTNRSVIDNLVTLTPNTNYSVMTPKWKDASNNDIPQTIVTSQTYNAQFEKNDKELYYTSNVEDIYLWKLNENPDTSNDTYRQMESIRGYILPIKDRNVPATFTEAYFGWNDAVAQKVERDTNNLISFDNDRNIVHLSGHTNANVGAYNRKIVVKDPYHTLKSDAVKVYISDASANPINKNVGEATTEEEIKNAVTINHPSGVSTAVNNVVKTVVYKPDNLNEGSYIAKVKLTNFKGVSKVVDVPVNYSLIDRTTNPSATTPTGYVRITLNAEANKGQLRVGNANVATKVYDVKAGTNRSVIDNLVTLVPNNNYHVATQKWKDSNSQDIPQIINNAGSYTAQFEQKLYVNTNDGNLENIFVWKINENPDTSSDTYRRMESVSTYTLPIKDRVNPTTFNNALFVNQRGVRSDVGSLSLTFDNTQNVVKLTGYANTAPGFNTRSVKVTDQAGNTLTTNSLLVVVFDASANLINKNVGETTTEEEIKAAVNINYGNYTTAGASREVTKEILYKPDNLNEGTYIAKVKLTNFKGMVKVVDVPVNYSLIDKTNEPNSQVTPGYVRITLTAENNKGQLTVNNQNVQTKVYDVKSGTNRSVIDNLVTLTPNANWRVMTQKWKDSNSQDIPNIISDGQNNKTYIAQFEEIDKAPYFESNTGNVNVGNYNDKIVIWKGENITKNLPIKDKDSASIEEGSLYFVDKVRDERSDFADITLAVNTNNQNEQQVTLSGKTNEAVGLYERRIKVKDETHNPNYTGTISINVIDANANKITVPFGTNPTEEAVRNAISINSQGTNLTSEEKEINYNINNNVITNGDKLSVNAELTNTSGQTKTVSVPVEYSYKSIKMDAPRPVRNSSVIKVNSEANGRTIKLYINQGKDNAVVVERVLSGNVVVFDLQTPLRKGDTIKIEMVAQENEIVAPPLLFKVR